MDIVKDVIVALAAAGILWLVGVPALLWRAASGRVTRWRLTRKLAAGLFDASAIEAATRYYVRPMYSNVDPANEWEPAHALINARAELFPMVDRFLSTDFIEQKHMLLFADSGMGKTSFLLNYLSHNYRFWNLRKKKIRLISLAQASADELIRAVPIEERAEINLFLDALDEDQMALSDVGRRISDLLRVCEAFRTVIITCRSQFFRDDGEIPTRTGIVKAGPVPLNKPKHYSFFRVYLSPFDDRQVKKYLNKRFPGPLSWRSRRIAASIVSRVPTLSVRPMLLAHMPEVIHSGRNVGSTADVYDVMVQAWVFRESAWVDPSALVRFSLDLALDLYEKRSERGGEAVEPQEIAGFTQQLGVPISSDLVTSRSLLNRTSDGRYKFAHRSILEFLVVEALLNKQPEMELRLTDQMWRFLLERLGCWTAEAQAIASMCNITVRFVEPVKKLGLATNVGLYSEIEDAVDVAKFLQLKCSTTPQGAPVRDIGSLINDMSFSAFGVEAPQLRGIRLLVDAESRGVRRIFASAWVNSYYAVAEVASSSRLLTEALAKVPDPHLRFALTAVPAVGTNDLSRATWTLSSAVNREAQAMFGYSIWAGMNNSLAFDYLPETNTLRVQALRLDRDQPSPLEVFGVFGVPKRKEVVSNRPYTMFGADLRNAWRYEAEAAWMR